MSNVKNKKIEVEWYDNPNVITNLLILMIALIVILSQSFAVNNGLSVNEILSSILNHNIGYLLVCVYFVALKTKIGKQYFDFLNIFMIILYGLTSVTSLLTVLQSFGLGSLLGFAIDLMILIFIIHTFLRSTRIWKSMGLSKSPFNEISNGGYFYSILVLSVTLLAVNLISTTSFDGTILTLMDAGYTILFIRYVFLYGEFLNSKKISINNEGNFEQIADKVKEEVNDFIEENRLDEKYEAVKDKVTEIAQDVKEKAIDIKENIEEKIEDAKIDEKIEVAKGKVSGFINEVTDDVKGFVKDAKVEEKIENAKKSVNKFVEENKIDEKIELAKEKVGEFVEEVRDDVKTFVKDAKVEEKVEKAKSEVNKFVDDLSNDVKSLVGSDKSKKEDATKEKKKGFFSSRKKKVKKTDTKKGNK